MKPRRPWFLLLTLIPWLWTGGAAFAAASASASLQVTTAATSYSPGDMVDISGTGAAPGAQVALEVEEPGGGDVFVDQVTADASGDFSDSFSLSSSAGAGTYSVYASTTTQKASASFSVGGGQTITLATDKANYYPGGTVEISGSSSAGTAASDAAIAVEVQDPSGTAVFADTVTADGNGNFSDSFTLSGGAATGPYMVIASATVEGKSESGSTSFQVVSPAAPPSGGSTATSCTGQPNGVVMDSTVGTAGATLTSTDGCVVLSVPAGAFASGATVTVTESTYGSLPPGDVEGLSPLYVLDFGGAKPTKPITAQFHFAVQGYAGLPQLRVGLFEQQGTLWQYVKDSIDAQDQVVDASILGAGSYLAAVNRTSFNDVPAGYWAETALDLMLGRDAISGYPDGGFHPDATVTRAEFVKMLVLALGLTVPGTGTSDGFSDVAANAWYAPYVDAAVSAQLVEGVTAESFEPDALITRAELAVMVARAMHGYTPAQPLKVQFSDQGRIGQWALPLIAQAAQAGIVHGLTTGAFDPNGYATRAQAAELVANLVTVTGQ